MINNDTIRLQIEAFKALASEVNEIPGVKIDLNKETDPQRDALAFVVDTIYRQFQSTEWQLVLQDLPTKVRIWNTPPDSFEATSKLLSLIRHLYEFRIVKMLENSNLSREEREYIENVHSLYNACVEKNLASTKPGNPVNFSGISYSLLPEWYLQKLYKETNQK